MRNALILPLALSFAISGGVADAKRPIREVPELYDPLFYIAVANEIHEKCPSISGKLVKGVIALQQLRATANRLGYSDDEIMAFYESEDERSRMARRGEAYLAQFGARRDNPDTLCALGRREINRNSAIGVYLKAN